MNQRFLASLVFLCATPVWAAEPSEHPALADYVAKPDSSYRWEKKREGTIGGATYAELLLVSQTWREIEWKHQLFLIKPQSMAADAKQGLLFIAGGGWRPELEEADGPAKLPREATLFAAIAEQMKAPVAVLLHVPHQPIFDGKVEDQIIAYTFDQFLKTRDPEWPLLLPMVKSAVRAMDATQKFAADEWGAKIESFTISGASKRGWTTWLTGAIDPRAVAIAPMVIDVLNMREQMQLQRKSFGKPSEEIADYTARGLTERLESPEAQTLRAIVDPYSYRGALKQPKLIILGTNDRYWPLDALNLYWDALEGTKYVMYVPNNGHGLNDIVRLSGSLLALHQHATAERLLPRVSWKYEPADGRMRLRIQSDRAPQRVEMWQARSATRDFRESQWTSKPARQEGDSFLCELEEPATGYAALFGEMVFEGQPLPFFLSTNVRILGPEAEKAGGQ